MDLKTRIKVVKTIKPYLIKLEILKIPEDSKEIILIQYNTLDLLSQDGYNYKELQFIMEYRFLVEAQIIIMLIDKLVPELENLRRELKNIFAKKEKGLHSN